MVDETMSGSGLSVDDVTVRYGDARRRSAAAATMAAVDGATFSVARGEVVGLLGPSGCGKSTLLRAIAGLEPLDSGSVRWEGDDLASVPPHRRGFGLVFQDGQLFVHRTVAENIAYGLRVQRLPRREREARVMSLLELVGLPGAGDRSVTELSGGERQRVALARSLAPAPRLLLLDEPLSALDRALRDRLADDLAGMLRSTGTTAILVTHDESEASTIADRVIRMEQGRLLDAPRATDIRVLPDRRDG